MPNANILLFLNWFVCHYLSLNTGACTIGNFTIGNCTGTETGTGAVTVACTGACIITNLRFRPRGLGASAFFMYFRFSLMAGLTIVVSGGLESMSPPLMKLPTESNWNSVWFSILCLSYTMYSGARGGVDGVGTSILMSWLFLLLSLLLLTTFTIELSRLG